MKATKIISIIVLLAVLVATVAGAYLGFAGRNTQMVTVTENGVETQRALYRQVAFIPNTFNTTWKEAIIPSAQLGGGIEYVFTAEQGDMTDADFSKAIKAAASHPVYKRLRPLLPPPVAMDKEASTTKKSTSSRSSSKSFTKGRPIRAVTFQSMERTSSPGR